MNNQQQLKYIQASFGVVQVNPTQVMVKEKVEGIEFIIEIIPSKSVKTGKPFVSFRTINSKGEPGLWSSWEDPEEVESWFRSMSLLS